MLPHVVRKVPVFVNFWMRLLPVSTTKTFPLASTATPKGLLNCPSPVPKLPHVVRKGQGSAGLHTHTQEFPSEEQTCELLEHVPPHVGAAEVSQVKGHTGQQPTPMMHAFPEPQSLSELQLPEQPMKNSNSAQTTEPRCPKPQVADESAQKEPGHPVSQGEEQEPHLGGAVVVVVVVVVDDVVVAVWQPGVPGVGHASQQLAQVPTVPCF